MNEEQFRVVTAPPKATLVVAGAGTGKTRAITYRVAYLIEQGVSPQRILLATFTKRAAREMLRRVETLTPVRDPDILAHLRDVVLDAFLKDNDRAMTLDSAGHYERRQKESGPFNSQQSLLQHYTERRD